MTLNRESTPSAPSSAGAPTPTLAPVLHWGGVLLVLAVTAFLASGMGSFDVSYGTVWKLWISPLLSAEGVDDTARYIVLNVRLARIALSIVVGGSLALAGAVYQGILLNPLADPYTLGVSTGAAFGASVAILTGIGGIHLVGAGALPVAAFVGAIGALYLVYFLGRMGGRAQSATLVLAGIMVSTFLSALISLLKSLNEDSVSTIVFWIMGSLSGKSWIHVFIVLPYLAAGCVIILRSTRELDILGMGDIQAHNLGVDVQKTRFRLLMAASLVTAAAVSVSGIIGFVGLVVPHLVRMVLGPHHRRLIPASLLSGGLLVLVSDTLARTLLPSGEEIPVGVVTALLGGPFFCYLLLHRRKTLHL